LYLLEWDKCQMFNLASNDGAFLVSTNADSDTSRHTCHVSATFHQYGVERTFVAPPLCIK